MDCRCVPGQEKLTLCHIFAQEKWTVELLETTIFFFLGLISLGIIFLGGETLIPLLISRGCDVNLVDLKGRTALHCCAKVKLTALH